MKYLEMTNNIEINNIEMNTCRICLEEEANEEILIAPCRCSGSSKHVHIECLQTWRQTASRDSEGENRCMECKTEYIIRKNFEREKQVEIKTWVIFKILYYLPFIVSFFVYETDKEYNLIKFLDGGEEYPTQKCNIYVDFYKKNHTYCSPLNIKGYIISGDEGIGYIFYVSILLSLYSFILITGFLMYQLKLLKKPLIFFKKYGYCRIFAHQIFSLKMFILYYLMRFVAPYGCIIFACFSIPLESCNITKAYLRYWNTLENMNENIRNDDTVLNWSENCLGYNMVEIDDDDEEDDDEEDDDEEDDEDDL